MTRGLLSALLVAGVAACGGDGGAAGGPEWVGDIADAVVAVEEALGGPQDYFEVTANPQLTNVFVAENDATEAVPYLYVDGELQPPGPILTGAGGHVFTADAIDIDEDLVLARVSEELPNATVETLSVEGGPGGSVRYIASARSESGGVLDIVVSAQGVILSVTAR